MDDTVETFDTAETVDTGNRTDCMRTNSLSRDDAYAQRN